MALSRIKVWVAEVLSYSDLNSEFSNILNNANSLISPFTADVAAGAFKITGLGAGTALTDAASITQLQNHFGSYLTSVSGTNTIVGTATPTPAYAVGQRFTFIPAVTNTGAVTLNISSVGAGAVQRAGAALTGGELVAGTPVTVLVTATTPVFEIIGQVQIHWSTGDVKLTLKIVADTGWVLMNDTTIGNAASGATGRANADTVNLFTLLWNNTADAQCAVSTGRGASAAADYAANKTISLPKALGRALAGYGAGSGLTNRVLALAFGAETHTLTTTEIPSHAHTGAQANSAANPSAGAASSNAIQYDNTASTNAAGGGAAHNNMQPTLFLNTMIKL